jgi:hypothetical protein
MKHLIGRVIIAGELGMEVDFDHHQFEPIYDTDLIAVIGEMEKTGEVFRDELGRPSLTKLGTAVVELANQQLANVIKKRTSGLVTVEII